MRAGSMAGGRSWTKWKTADDVRQVSRKRTLLETHFEDVRLVLVRLSVGGGSVVVVVVESLLGRKTGEVGVERLVRVLRILPLAAMK